PAVTRILGGVARWAPALPDARNAHPGPDAVARLLTTGVPAQRPGEPGLFVTFGHADAWLHRNRLGVTLGSATSGATLLLDGPWDAPGTARLTDLVLRELTDAGSLAREVAALLPASGRAQVEADRWHPDAAVIVCRGRFDPADPLGRAVSRELRGVSRVLESARPDWEVQHLWSNEGSRVAVRVTRRGRSVPELAKRSRWVPDNPFQSNGSGTFQSEYAPPGAPFRW
ncbi:MAG TPA: hypothetical protein VK545_16355, partial [Streptomyces sp.]|nr:hypothetical protein [Streptomyces sp.]